jgi:O-antigen ligase
VVELGLAGNWRGLFSHKNIAGPMMVIFAFIGIFVAKTRHAVLGWSITIAAGIFLLCTGAKTATALVPLVLLLSWTCLRVRSLALQGVLLLSLLVGLNVFTVGSLYSGVAKSINEYVLPDPTFTGRTDIWQFAIDGIVERPVFGFGMGSFWQREQTVGGPSLEWEGPESASHAHNSFLDLALTTGIPGLILGLLWTVALPIRDLHRSIATEADPDLTKLFLRIWLFGLYCCPFESPIFAGNSPIWFSMLSAMFGLRYLSTGRSIR